MLILPNGLVTLFTLNVGIAYFIVNCAAFHILQTSNVTRIKRQATNCSEFQFKCDSGECIPKSKSCDGITDCADSSDETSRCLQAASSCPSLAFRCAYGACVDGDAKCNNKRECVDGSDEANCTNNTNIPNNCGLNKFPCKNGDCVSSYLVCDGAKGCADGSDETYELCSSSQCQHYSFRCTYGACVDGDAKCNGIPDCVDGSDETPELCGGITTTTQSSVGRPTQDGCVIPPKPENGKYEGYPKQVVLNVGNAVNDETILIYKCKDGYSLASMKPTEKVICLNKKWDSAFPACIRTCPPRVSEYVETACEYKNIKNINCSLPMLEGTRVSMSCIHNFESTDGSSKNPVSVCRDGSWDYNILKCIPGCGKQTTPLETFIVNGTTAKMGEFPWHVGIYLLEENSKYGQVCGGSLISMNIVVSAAHCFTDPNSGTLIDMKLYMIAAGKYYRSFYNTNDTTAQTSKVKDVKIPEDYKGVLNSYRDDLAIVILQNKFTVTHVVQPVCVDWDLQWEDEQLKSESYGDVVGWGYTQADSNPSEELKHLRAPYVENKKCYEVLPQTFYLFITTDKFCAGYTNGSSVCKGDSGGGLVFLRSATNRYYIRGVVSSGPKINFGCDPRKYSLFTRISNFMKFISEIESANRIN